MKDLRHTDERSVVSLEDDERSNCTSATTASLASRIQSLAVDFGPKHRQRTYDQFVEDEEEEDMISIPEEELLKELERQEPAFQVCSRLFKQPFSRSLNLKHLDLEKGEAFRSTGYTVVDNFITKDYAMRLRSEAMLLNRQGVMRYASQLFRDRATDDTARGDKIAWLHPATQPANSAFHPLFAAIKELQDDLSKLMHLNGTKTEIQLGYYPPNGAQYVRHRDAFPDDGSESDQRRVTAILYLNPGWRREDGGKLRLWLPQAEAPAEAVTQPEAQLSSRACSTQPGSPTLRPQPSGNPSSESSANGTLGHSSDQQRQNSGRLTSPALNGHAAESSHRPTTSLGEFSDGVPDQPEARGHYEPPVQANGHHDPNSSHLNRHAHSNGYAHDLAESPSGNGSSHRGLSHELNALDLEDGPQAHLAFDQNHNLGARLHSPGSLNGSLIVEPTEASSAHDNASVDGSARGITESRTKGAEDVEVGTAAAVDVAPKAGSLVIFLSGAIEHAVLPNFSDRLAVTFWMQ